MEFILQHEQCTRMSTRSWKSSLEVNGLGSIINVLYEWQMNQNSYNVFLCRTYSILVNCIVNINFSHGVFVLLFLWSVF